MGAWTLSLVLKTRVRRRVYRKQAGRARCARTTHVDRADDGMANENEVDTSNNVKDKDEEDGDRMSW